MQLAGNIFSTVSATVGNSISTFPDYPADIRAPQGSLTGVSGFQVHVGAGQVYTPGDQCDVLVAMNAAALKTQYRYAKPGAAIIIDTDSFGPKDLQKAAFQSEDYLGEMGIDPDRVIACPLTTMVKNCLKDSGMDVKSILKCRNMFALGLVCWLFDRDLDIAFNFLREKFAKKPGVAEANIKVIQADAPDGLLELPRATHAFIGGSGGNLEAILQTLYEINPRMRVVLNAITVETICKIQELLAQYPVAHEEMVQLQISRTKVAGRYHLMQAENPVWVCAFTFCEQ